MNHTTTSTRSRRLVSAVAASCAALVSIAVATGPVSGAPPEAVSLPFFGPIEGADGQEGTFAGAIAEPEFTNENGTLTLNGVLDGVASIDEATVRIEDQALSTAVDPSVAGSVAAEDANGPSGTEPGGTEPGGWRRTATGPEPDADKCDVLYLDIQPITLDLLGLEVLTSRITVDVNAIPGDGNLAGNLVCALAGLLDGLPDTLDDVVEQLNQLIGQTTTTAPVGTAADTGPAPLAGSLPISWPLEGPNGETGTFTGTVSDLAFSEDDGVLLDGVLNGIIDTGGDPVRVVDQPLAGPVTPSVVGSIPSQQFVDNPTQPEPDPDKCDVLYLDIQPITLNLLGLEVLTSRITVDVNAVPGEGNLAGNLVCALAGLLDGTPDAIAEITDQLNQVVGELGVASPSAVPTSVPGEPVDTVTGATVAPTDSVLDTGGTVPEVTEPAGEPTPTEPSPTEPPSEPTAPPATEAPTEPTG